MTCQRGRDNCTTAGTRFSSRVLYNARKLVGPPLLLDHVDHLVDAGGVLVLHKLRETSHAPKLRVIGLVSPAAVVVLGHVEQPEGDDLILVTDVAGMVGALQAGRHRLARLPGAAKGLPRAWLQAAGGEHDDHFDLLW